MFRKILILFVAYFTAVFITGCCNCDPTPTTRFQWTHLSLQQMHFSRDASGNLVSEPDSATDFSGKQYALRGNLHYELMAATKCLKKDLGLVTAAVACKCDLANFSARIRAGAIRIFTLMPFDQQHPTGSEVTTFFQTRRHGSNSELEAVHHDFQTYGESDGDPDGIFERYMLRPLHTGQWYQFRVEIALEDGSSLSAIALAVRL